MLLYTKRETGVTTSITSFQETLGIPRKVKMSEEQPEEEEKSVVNDVVQYYKVRLSTIQLSLDSLFVEPRV